MDPIYLRVDSASVLIDVSSGEPSVLHWGADLGATLPDLSALGSGGMPVPHSALDTPVVLGLLPQASSGWRGRPGLRGSAVTQGAAGTGFSARLSLTGMRATGTSAILTQEDAELGLTVVSELNLHDGGLLEIRHTLTNEGTTDYALEELAAVLPIGPDGTEILDLTGRWCRERHPQRRPVQQGTWLRSGRHGRTGHDSALLLAVGSAGFGNRQGKVWAAHFAWSGNHQAYVEGLADGRTVIGAAELLGSGEVLLTPGQSYATPPLFAAYSDRGLDGISEAFYAWFRARGHHPSSPRPVVVNTWEAVYFNHDLDVLTELAASAAELGAERFVLDDGWFRHRRDDHAGLGDWYVDADIWPDGLGPLIEAVTSRGMEFGLWVEPEMINSDSDTARAHPDWIAGPAAARAEPAGQAEPADGVETAAWSRPDQTHRLPLEWRHQQVLDLVNPEAWQYIYDRMDALLTAHPIAYLKWDQNRDLLEMGHADRPSVHEQTLAAYRLFDALRAAHPTVEIESCSSGGARVDLGILERTDRIWASDCNDALERQTIQRWTGIVVPPELVGSHIGPTTSHTTARTHELSFRAITALFGHFGFEWDIRTVAGAERDELRGFIALYKRFRPLIHGGRMVRADLPDPSLLLHGVVVGDATEALFALVAVSTSYAEQTGRVCVPGLAAERNYRVDLIYPMRGGTFTQAAPPAWVADGVRASGQFLAEVGLPMPILNPEHAILLHFSAP
ncbi:alpha-galactosidase [Paenarthrobacter sp. PH39-S1]|uniref:alpha-galactosidase n=1 Tax=Paenarthrobacter sp. PH39-S1 TaxID=3046204 RepID=UPI0024B95178|nr:alpha-galactosidase [Paenarthrobacter sp. PH39-S1]MDJ0355178.1 alpha-galactosidase [Paenarthrobacter sp. PH39-S1]